MFLIATQGVPKLSEAVRWSEVMHEFIELCFMVKAEERRQAEEMLHHEYIQGVCSQADAARCLAEARDLKCRKMRERRTRCLAFMSSRQRARGVESWRARYMVDRGAATRRFVKYRKREGQDNPPSSKELGFDSDSLQADQVSTRAHAAAMSRGKRDTYETGAHDAVIKLARYLSHELCSPLHATPVILPASRSKPRTTRAEEDGQAG